MKFYLSCKHHCYYCFCSKERSLKFEIFSFASFKSLFILVAIALIFCYQIIVFELMFNSYQIDLSSKSTSFFNISSVLFSLIISLTVLYIIFIFVFKSSKTLHFDEHNITKFLKRLKKQCNEYKIIEKKRWIKLSRYCVRFIANFMKISFLYINRSWNVFEKKIRKKYKN